MRKLHFKATVPAIGKMQVKRGYVCSLPPSRSAKGE